MNLPHDNDLERLLDGDGGDLSALYRRLPRVEPPRRLDRSVLGEAARAVHGQIPRKHRWIVGFGSAAGIVLAAGVAWHVGQNAMQQQSYDAYRMAPSVVPVEPITESSALRKRERERANAAQSAAASSPPAAEMEPAAAPPPEPAKPSLARKAAPKPPPPPAAARETMPPAPAPVAAPVPQSPVPFPAQDAQRSEGDASATATGALSPKVEELKAKQVGGAVLLDKVAPDRVHSNAPPAPSSSVELRRDMQLSPGDWLAHIEQLLHQGRRQQALDSLRLFRRVHPDQHLSDELRALEN
jgi:hypothetical protein